MTNKLIDKISEVRHKCGSFIVNKKVLSHNEKKDILCLLPKKSHHFSLIDGAHHVYVSFVGRKSRRQEAAMLLRLLSC